jgi:hypothetical protein
MWLEWLRIERDNFDSSISIYIWRIAHLRVKSLSNTTIRFIIYTFDTTYVYFRLIERLYDKTSLNLTRHFIKLVVSNSLNLINENVILLNLTKAIHHTWRKKRYLIKSNKRVISSNIFEKRDNLSTFWWAIFCSDIWCEKLSFAKDHLLCKDKCLYEIIMINERFQ